MQFVTHSHRYAEYIIPHDSPAEYAEVMDTLTGLTDDEIISQFESDSRESKSLSKAINALLHHRLVALRWRAEAPIFQDANYDEQRWRLDFAKGHVSVEVAFNHGEAIAWNLVKPVLASEYNHVRKAVQTRFGMVICATEELKSAGGFDSAVGSYEKFVRYLMPFQQILSVPLMIIGLKAPRSFRVVLRSEGNRRYGSIDRTSTTSSF